MNNWFPLYDQWFVMGWNTLHNKLWLQFDMTTPMGVSGYVFDFAFFTSEYPTYINTIYNDMFIAWQSLESYTGNLTSSAKRR